MTDPSDINTSNDHLVGVQSDKVTVLIPPTAMPVEEALRFAAWIVTCAMVSDPNADEHFAQILEAVRNT